MWQHSYLPPPCPMEKGHFTPKMAKCPKTFAGNCTLKKSYYSIKWHSIKWLLYEDLHPSVYTNQGQKLSYQNLKPNRKWIFVNHRKKIVIYIATVIYATAMPISECRKTVMSLNCYLTILLMSPFHIFFFKLSRI